MGAGPQNRNGENQHYVPRFLLKNFCPPLGNKETIDVFDKRELRLFKANISKIAAEIDFNVINTLGHRVSLENGYTAIENVAAPLVAKLRTARTLTVLTSEERYTLAIFAGSMFLRNARLRGDIKAIGARIKEIVSANFGKRALTPEVSSADSDEYAKHMASYIHFDEVKTYADMFLEKDWLLVGPDAGGSFVLSDNPVVMHNDNDYGPYGNFGILVPGIYIYLPVAPDLVLGFWCPSNRKRLLENFRRGFEGIRTMERLRRLGMDKFDDAIAFNFHEYERVILESYNYIYSIESGNACSIGRAAREHLNVLQVYSSSRFILGAGGNEGYIVNYLDEFPEARQPFRVRVS